MLDPLPRSERVVRKRSPRGLLRAARGHRLVVAAVDEIFVTDFLYRIRIFEPILRVRQCPTPASVNGAKRNSAAGLHAKWGL